MGGFADDANDEQARRYARALEERDHEAGSARAREMLEMEQRRKEEAGRNGIEKHWSEKKLENMRERDFRIMKEDYQIQIRSGSSGGTVINPMRSWQESGLPKTMLDVVAAVGYDEPSAIQRAAIPIALKARDIIGVAVTGSGKTAAFVSFKPSSPINANDVCSCFPYLFISATCRDSTKRPRTMDLLQSY